MAKKVKKRVGKISSTNTNSKRRVKWTTALILSILLGFLGIDRFYMGHVGLGVLKLLLTILTLGILGWIWWLIDVILIATKHEFKDIHWAE